MGNILDSAVAAILFAIPAIFIFSAGSTNNFFLLVGIGFTVLSAKHGLDFVRCILREL